MLNLSLFDLVPPVDIETEKALYERQIAGELQTYALERRYIRKDGSSAWLQMSSTAVFDNEGQFQYSVRVIQDIDQRKRFEQRQALLVRELRHRVRNTLAVVEALAGELQGLLGDARERAALARRARETVARAFTWQRCGEETVRAYADALAG